MPPFLSIHVATHEKSSLGRRLGRERRQARPGQRPCEPWAKGWLLGTTRVIALLLLLPLALLWRLRSQTGCIVLPAAISIAAAAAAIS